MEINKIEKNFNKDPLGILDLIYYRTSCSMEIEDEAYYEILRLRGLITPKLFKSGRVAKIIENVFNSKRAYYFVRALNELELLETVFPGIARLISVDGGHYHNETVFTHVMGALRAVDKLDIPWYVKLAALYHDAGKYKWEISDAGKRRFTHHAQNGVPVVENDLTRLKIAPEIIHTVKVLVGAHMSQIDGPHSIRKLNRLFEKENIPVKYFFWVRYADNKGSAVYKTNFMYYWSLYRTFKSTLYVKKEPSVTDLAVNGKSLMKEFGKGPGKWIGMTLRYLFVGVQERGYENTEEFLLKEAHKFVDWYVDGSIG